MPEKRKHYFSRSGRDTVEFEDVLTRENRLIEAFKVLFKSHCLIADHSNWQRCSLCRDAAETVEEMRRTQ